jgi:hypothetical protein
MDGWIARRVALGNTWATVSLISSLYSIYFVSYYNKVMMMFSSGKTRKLVPGSSVSLHLPSFLHETWHIRWVWLSLPNGFVVVVVAPAAPPVSGANWDGRANFGRREREWRKLFTFTEMFLSAPLVRVSVPFFKNMYSRSEIVCALILIWFHRYSWNGRWRENQRNKSKETVFVVDPTFWVASFSLASQETGFRELQTFGRNV